MPFDAHFDYSTLTGSEKIRALADYIEMLPAEKLDMLNVYHKCGTPSCAWGHGEALGIIPDTHGGGWTHSVAWTLEQRGAGNGRSPVFGFQTLDAFNHCFGSGHQFDYLGRPYASADVARHLREAADQLEAVHV